MDRRTFFKSLFKKALWVPPIVGTTVTLGSVGYMLINTSPKYDLPPPRIRTFKHNNSTVKLVGVSHANGFFETYRKTLDEHINSCDVILVERSPAALGYDDKEIFMNNRDDALAKSGARILNVDPRNASTRARIAAPATELAQLVGGYTLALRKLDFDKLTFWSATRRSFMYYMGLSSFVGSLLFVSALGVPQRSLYNHADLTDIVLAETIDKLSIDKQTIGMIYGGGHVEGVNYYLNHPIFRDVKKTLYLPQRLLTGEPKKEFTLGNTWTSNPYRPT